MNKHILALGTTLALGLGATAAHAGDQFLFQFDDTVEGHLWANTYQNGTLIQSVDVGPESYGSGYGLQWNGTGAVLTSDIDVAVNIYDIDGVTLSDTWHLFGLAGDGLLQIPFVSDVEGQTLTPLPNGIRMIETGGWQTVLENDLANGDHFIWQFASDVGDVPEPASWAMMLAGFGLLGMAMRARRHGIAVAA
jgi:hypothetical protein